MIFCVLYSNLKVGSRWCLTAGFSVAKIIRAKSTKENCYPVSRPPLRMGPHWQTRFHGSEVLPRTEGGVNLQANRMDSKGDMGTVSGFTRATSPGVNISDSHCCQEGAHPVNS